MTNRFRILLLPGLLAVLSAPAFSQNQLVRIEGPNTICGGCITLTAVFDSTVANTPVLFLSWLDSNGLLLGQGKQITVCQPGSYTLWLQFSGAITVKDTHQVVQASYIPVEIVSDNPATCNPDSLSHSDPNDVALCEKVCPFSTVTYSIQNMPVLGSTTSSIVWTVNGAQSFTVNPPFQQSVTVQWGPTGTGSVSVVVKSGSNPGQNGCVGETSRCVTIVDEPVAQFNTTPAPPGAGNLQVCKGQTVYFNNTSQYADAYEWWFSDNAALANDINPQHTFSTPGLYTVHLVARSACLCSDTTEISIEVLDAEAATLDCVGDVCPGASVTYKASANCNNIAWAVSGNGTALNGGATGADSITVQWNGGPAGEITLSGYACAGQACPFPTVIRIPVIDDNAEIRGVETVCPDATEVYNIEPFGGTGFVWKLSGGGAIVEGQGSSRVSVRWNTTANPNTVYWLSVVYDNCYLGCGGRDSIPVRIASPFIVNGPVEACANTSKSFSSKLTTNGQNLLCNWTLQGPAGTVVWVSPGPTATPSVTFADGPGLYRLFAVPDNPALSCTAEGEWAINVPAPPAGPTGIDGPALICPTQTYTYSAAGVAPGASIRWTVQNGPGAPTQAIGNPLNIGWNAAGPYQLSATEISADGLGCPSAPVQLTPQAAGSLTLNGPAQACANSTATYSVPAIPGLEYQWTLQPADAGAIVQGQGTNSVDIFWQTPGNRTLSLGVCGQTANLAVTVNPLPAPAVNHPAEICTGGTAPVTTSTPFAMYAWATASGASLGSTGAVNLGPGNYALTVTDANGCTAATNFSINTAPGPNLTVSTADPTGFCNNSQTVTMQALTNSGGSLTYEWFKDNIPLGVNSPYYSTNQYGSYTVQATTTAGCTATAGPIVVFQDCGGGGGGGGFPGPGGPGCPPGSLGIMIDPSARCDSFDFQVTGANYLPGSAQWIFGQSGAAVTGSAAGDQVAFTFPNAGYYIVVMTGELTSGGVCRVVDSLSVEAVAAFDALPECPGNATGFEENSAFMPGSGITAWNWNFGDPPSGAQNTGSGPAPTHVYAAAGAYPVTLTVTANSGCTSAATQPANIPLPAPPVFAPPAGACAGNAVAFSASGSNIGWNFGDPASGALNTASGSPAYHNFPAGNFTVTATATDAYGCISSAAQNVSIAANTLGGAITPANPAPLCEGGTIVLNAPAGATDYLWSDNSTDPSLIVSQEGVYSVTLTDGNGCTFIPPPVNVEITPGPDALIKALLINTLGQTIGTAYPAYSVCFGQDVRLIAQGAGAYTYTWSTGQTGNGIEFSEVRGNLLAVGTHTYTVTVTETSTGCTAITDPFVVTVNPVPAGFSVANSAAPACAAAVNTLSYTGPNPGNWQFIWNTGQTDVPLVTENPGVYFLRVINEFGCEARSNPLVILPGPNVLAVPAGCHTRCRPDTLCLPPMPGITAWQWFFNGSALPGATSSTFVPAQSGTYWAELTDAAGCTNQSGPLTLNLLDGYGNILGQVWADVNNNGLIDGPDTLVSGIAVKLLQGGTPAGNTQSGASGDFAFTNILSTNYTVEIDPALLPANWQIVIGQRPASLSGCDAETQLGLLLKFACVTTVTSDVELSACPGGSALYNGTPVATGSSQTFQLIAANGCDSLVTVSVVALPASTGSLNVSACPGASYDYNGTLIPAGTSQNFTLQNSLGCDSVLTVTVGVLPTSTGALNVAVCPGASYDYNGTLIPAGTSQNFTLQNSLGCDSVLTVTVGALPTSTGALNVAVCPGASYDYNGTPIPAGTSQNFILQNSQGCDSVLTVTVATLPTSTGALNVAVCPGAAYDYNGTLIPAGASQNFTLQNSLGCDSVLTVTVGALPTSTGALNVAVCPGASYDYNGTMIPAGTSQNFTLQNSLGCDSVLTVTVGALPTSTGALNVAVCPGAAYDYNGTLIPAGTSQNFTLQNSLGCDSVLTVTVGTLPTSTGALNVAVCPGTAYNYNGTMIPAGTSQNFTLQNSLGCDSVLTVTVGALPTSTGALNVAVCPGAAYNYNGTMIPAGASQNFTLQNSLGCDSVLTVTVGALPTSTGTLNVAVCPGAAYNYNGTLIPAGSSQNFTLQNSLGCDSVLTVTVGALPTSTGTLNVAVCPGASYDYNGTLIPAGTSRNITLQNSLGCDSVLTVTVGTLPVAASALNVAVCPGESFVYQGTPLQIGQSQVFPLQSANGCDSLVTVTVGALATSSETLNVTICPDETYTYSGVELKPGETRPFVFTNQEGCDSTVIVVVAAYPTATFDLVATPSCADSASGTLLVKNPAGGLPPYRYSLDGLAFQDELEFKNLKPGDYSVWLEDSNGCLFRQDTALPARAPLSLELADAQLPCDSGGVQLTPIVGGDPEGLAYQWSTGAQTPSITVYDPGPVWLELRNVCETTRQDISVAWENIGTGISYVYVPNVFAPLSNDPDNARFRPYFAQGLTLANYKFEIFDRWGNLMFRTLDTQEGWTGPFRQEDMQPAVFVWYLYVDVLYCGRVRHLELKRDVTIVR